MLILSALAPMELLYLVVVNIQLLKFGGSSLKRMSDESPELPILKEGIGTLVLDALHVFSTTRSIRKVSTFTVLALQWLITSEMPLSLRHC